MKKRYLALLVLLIANIAFSQSIQDIMNEVSNANLQLSVNELSGEQDDLISVCADGSKYRHFATAFV